MTKAKTRCGGRWTEARYRSFIISALRSATMRWGVINDALEKAYVRRKKNPKTNRLCNYYECAECKNHFPRKEVSVDHIEPVVPLTGFDSWDGYIERMFCEEDNLQVLCKECHDVKSKMENYTRRKNARQGK